MSNATITESSLEIAISRCRYCFRMHGIYGWVCVWEREREREREEEGARERERERKRERDGGGDVLQEYVDTGHLSLPGCIDFGPSRYGS